MSWTDRFYGDVMAPLWERRDGYVFRDYLRSLEVSQFWSADDLRQLQEKRLNALLRQAHAHSAFHRERLEAAGYAPDTTWTVPDLQRLPVLEKEDIRQQTDRLLADNFDRDALHPKRTGGSTSVPLRLYLDTDAMNRKYAATWRHNRWAGYSMGDRYALVWGNEPGPRNAKERLRRALYERYFSLDTLHMSDQAMSAFLDRVIRERPAVLMGHAHSVYLLADYARRTASRARLESVITTAMVLLEAERRVIEEAFGARVFDRYGCEELSIIASECPEQHRRHIHAEGLVVEILRDGEPASPGEFGDVVLTDLTNFAMPLIRYRVGDVSALSPDTCPCGCGLPVLQEVRGRTADFLYSPEGTPVFGISILDSFLIHIPGIRQAQLIQELQDEIRVRLVVPKGLDDELQARIRQGLASYFGPAMGYRLEPVDRIDPEPNGKYRFAICRLEPLPAGGAAFVPGTGGVD